MKAKNLNHIETEIAPKEWREIPEIKAQYPTHKYVEKSLQKLKGVNICLWMVGSKGLWMPASDYFYVRK